jgi:hypothetical protein
VSGADLHSISRREGKNNEKLPRQIKGELPSFCPSGETLS